MSRAPFLHGLFAPWNSGPVARNRRSHRGRLTCEFLEFRRLLAVSNLLDSGPGSLRNEIAAAAPGGTVTFTAGLVGTITLTSGQLVVDKALTIDGSGASITVSGNNASRVLKIDDGSDTTFRDVVLRNITISNGVATVEPTRADGGGILSFENLTLDGVTVSNNKANANSEDDGGGLSHGTEDRPAGDLTVRNSIFEDNTSFDDGSAIDFYNAKNLTITGSHIRNNILGDATAGSAANVGALRVIHAGAGDPFAGSQVTIRDSFFQDNRAIGSSVTSSASIGNALLVSGSPDAGWSLEIENTVVSGNRDVPDPGQPFSGYGALVVDSISPVVIRNSTISGNFTTIGAGGLYLGARYAALDATVDNVTVENNGTNGAGLVTEMGGGVYILASYVDSPANVTINGGSITGNHGVEGGGLWVGGGASVVVNGTNISGNTAVRGGGIYTFNDGNANTLELNGVTVDGNTASLGGGGIRARGYFYYDEVTIRNSTISRNVVTGDPADPTLGHGGGIEFEATTLTIEQSTISGNRAVQHGGGLFGGDNNYELTITRSSITDNIANSDGDSTGKGGGIHLTDMISSVSLDNTIVAGNSDLSSSAPSPDVTDNGIAIAATSSFIGTNAGSTLSPSPGPNTPDANGNLIGGGANGLINPGLGGLGNHGGPTETHVPNPGSPVMDRGSGTRATDQRGMPGVVGPAVDIGSVERGAESLNLDFNNDGQYNCADMSLLEAAIDSGGPVGTFDVNGDGALTSADVFEWLADAGELRFGPGRIFRSGDGNLDGSVDGSDFGVWNANKFTTARTWCQGDFNQDNAVDGSDFGVWNANKFTASDGARPVVQPPVTAKNRDDDESRSQRARLVDAVFGSMN